MTGSSRRRRRRRRSGGSGRPAPQAASDDTEQSGGLDPPATRSRRRRRGRGPRASLERLTGSPSSSEDLVRAAARERPETLTLPPDGQTLENVIGDLQSTFGVPQYPQEYRITIKVSEPRPERATGVENGSTSSINGEPPVSDEGGPRREKAPAAPRMGSATDPATEGPGRPRRRRGRGRGRRRGGGPSAATGGDGG